MLIGNLTRDPEVRYTPSGTAVCTFGMATNRSWTPSDGSETQEETEFHRLVCFGKLAEICQQLLFKGRKVYCDGRLQTRKWTGNDGQERQTTEIVIDNMIALSPPKGSGGGYPSDEYSDLDDPSAYEGSGFSDQSGGSSAPETSTSEEAPKETKPAAKKSDAEEEVDVDDIPF